VDVTADRSRTEIVGWIAASAVVLLLAWKLLAPHGGGAAGARVSVSRPAAAAEPGASGRALYVHVAGMVHRPGLYRLAGGSRVATAIDRAGGARRGADLSAVNLAMRVQDGQQVLVPRRGVVPTAAAGAGAGGTGGAGAAAGGVRLSLATATAEQLEQLDGIGPTLAKRIVDYRQQHGGFRSLDELKEVEGIGEKRFEALKRSLGP
jgi:competence protein ComEA